MLVSAVWRCAWRSSASVSRAAAARPCRCMTASGANAMTLRRSRGTTASPRARPVSVILRQVDGRTLGVGESAVEVLPGSHKLLVDCRIAETDSVSRHLIEAEIPPAAGIVSWRKPPPACASAPRFTFRHWTNGRRGDAGHDVAGACSQEARGSLHFFSRRAAEHKQAIIDSVATYARPCCALSF